LAIAFSSPTLAGEEKTSSRTPARTPEGPVDIRSDSLTVHQKKHRAVFSGNVQAVQGDLTIRCQRLTVSYQNPDDQKTKASKIRMMVFEGDVSITQGLRKGHCQRAEYDRPKGRIVCTGTPWVIEGENKIRGDRIVYFLEKDEVRVTRPRAVIQLEETKEEGPEK
jgi:lipopolysaccharide export system protein LptA